MSHILDHHEEVDSIDLFGFWIYILSDCILFAILFACFAVLRTNVYGGEALASLMNLPMVFIETMALLLSSLTYGFAVLASYKKNLRSVLMWLLMTCLLGLCFIGMELSEFYHLALEGHLWSSSAALSAFFTLVGTHGLHVSLGLLWMVILMVQLMYYRITPLMEKRLAYLALFWTFLDIVWIFVFTFVYLMGA